jgi:hypothetical protein
MIFTRFSESLVFFAPVWLGNYHDYFAAVVIIIYMKQEIIEHDYFAAVVIIIYMKQEIIEMTH